MIFKVNLIQVREVHLHIQIPVEITTQINAASGGLLVNDSTVVHDGLHIKVNHPNHGMYAPENLVKIDDVDPDHPSVDATADIAEDSTAQFLSIIYYLMRVVLVYLLILKT